MAEPDDPELLRRYVEDGAENAFTEFVRRHLDFVYSQALRRVGGETAAAEAAAIEVFSAAAKEAAGLKTQPLLTGWLHRRTRLASDRVGRLAAGRSPRDAAAAAHESAALEWDEVGGSVDAAIEQMPELDREALLRRVLRHQSWEQAGAELSLTTSAVQMRVERGIGRVLAALTERGVTIAPAALEHWLARTPATSAPPSLLAKVVTAALAAATTEAQRAGAAETRPTWKISFAVAVAVAAASVLWALRQDRALDAAADELGRARGENERLAAELQATRDRLQAEAKRSQAADEDNARLLEAMTSVAATPVAPANATEAITPEAVRTRLRRAGELARQRQFAEALREYLWCYDEGMARIGGLRGLRRGLVARALADLGRQYPAATEALRNRRDRAQEQMLAHQEDNEATNDFAELNDALGEARRTVTEFDRLPAGDPRRAALINRVKDELAANGRYRDVVQARPYWQMNSEFETLVAGAGATGSSITPAVRQEMHDSIVRSTIADVEILAGDGDLTHARTLARRLLAFDDSPETRALLEQRLNRAGQPELFTNLSRR